jgi:phage shock protein A
MSFATRLRDLFRVKANAALDRVEDPRQSLDDGYERQVDMLAQLRRGVAEVTTARKRIELQGQELAVRHARLGESAQEAMGQNREDLARIALERRASVEQEIVLLRRQYDSLQQQEDRLLENERRMSAQIAAFRTQKETLKASYTASAAQVKANETVAGLSSDFGAASRALDHAKDKVLQMQARAAATDELISRGVLQDQTVVPDEDLDYRIAAGRSTSDIERQLKAMRDARPGSSGAVASGAQGWLGIGQTPTTAPEPAEG